MSSPADTVLSNSCIVQMMFNVGSTPDTLFALLAVSRCLRRSTFPVLRHLYSPRRFLHLMFPDRAFPVALLASDELMVTGAPVLRYLSDFAVRRAGLVFAVFPPALRGVLDFLSADGYVLHSVDRVAASNQYSAFNETYVFRRGCALSAVWVHVVRSSLLELVLAQRTTCFFNGITRGRFFSLYPKLSLQQRRGLVLTAKQLLQPSGDPYAVTGGSPYAIEQYGYRHENQSTALAHPSLSVSPRYFGDKWTWIGPAPHDVPSICFLEQSWELSRHRRRDISRGLLFVVDTEILALPSAARPVLIAPTYAQRAAEFLPSLGVLPNRSHDVLKAVRDSVSSPH